MASVQEMYTKDKELFFKIRIFCGRDEKGKQRFKTKTFHPTEGMTKRQARAEAKRVAEQMESQMFRKEPENAEEAPAVRRYTFGEYADEVWIPMYVKNGERRHTTEAMYIYILDFIRKKLNECVLTEITPLLINQYFYWLRNDYRTVRGKRLSEKTIKHHYNILKMFFSHAESMEIITSNPMKKVAPPKVSKSTVDAMSKEDSIAFLSLLKCQDFEFQCIIWLLITTGMRRGECMGLRWEDIDLPQQNLTIRRNVTYTSARGIVVDEPKTEKSKRTIPLLQSVVNRLVLLKNIQQKKYQNHNIEKLYLFGKEERMYPKAPNSVTRRLRRFIKRNGLPSISPHDLRHTCASLMLAEGADIKSVQEILGHTDARTTLNYYVRTDINQMKVAVSTLESLVE